MTGAVHVVQGTASSVGLAGDIDRGDGYRLATAPGEHLDREQLLCRLAGVRARRPTGGAP